MEQREDPAELGFLHVSKPSRTALLRSFRDERRLGGKSLHQFLFHDQHRASRKHPSQRDEVFSVPPPLSLIDYQVELNHKGIAPIYVVAFRRRRKSG